MKTASTLIGSEVVSVIRASTFAGNRMTLPSTMDRKLYTLVAETIERFGGKWSKKEKCHLFPDGSVAKAIMRPILDGEDMSMPTKNPYAFFPTPPDVIALMLQEALLEPHCFRNPHPRFLEPSAGEGDIVKAMRAANPNAIITAVELDAARVVTLQKLNLPNVDIFDLDFMDVRNPFRRFDRILMNPPFAVDGSPLAYIDHITHAFTMLEPGGRLIAIAPAGFTFREDHKCSAFRQWVSGHGDCVELPENAFLSSGTGVRTVMITLEAPR